MRECSFTPNLQQTERLNRSLDFDRSPRYDRLYSRHRDKLISLENKSAIQQNLELEECTFIPKVNNGSLTLERYTKSCAKERQKAACSISESNEIISNNKRLNSFDIRKNSSNSLYTKLYKDSDRYKEKKRIKEYNLRQQKLKECTFVPQKFSKLEYEYHNEFKNPNVRLYNNYFEVQKKIGVAREERNKELRSLSESKTHQTINFSITNNFINSSINLNSEEKSLSKVFEKLYQEDKARKKRHKFLVQKVNDQTGVNFKPKINKKYRSGSQKTSSSLNDNKDISKFSSEKTFESSDPIDLTFHPKVSYKSRKLAESKRKRNNIPKPTQKRKSPRSPSFDLTDRLCYEYKDQENDLEKLVIKQMNEEEKSCTFMPVLSAKTKTVIRDHSFNNF